MRNVDRYLMGRKDERITITLTPALLARIDEEAKKRHAGRAGVVQFLLALACDRLDEDEAAAAVSEKKGARR